MLKNKEFQIYLLIQIVLISLTLTGMVHLPCKTVVCLMGLMCLFVASIIFTTIRYKNIAKLSNYLLEIRNGNYGLDIREYSESELSILKNEIYKMTLTLTEQAELLKKDKLYLADAISDISHQLKTPLTSIGVMTELLEDDHLDAIKKKEFLHNIDNSNLRISWLVTALLKMAKLDAGSVILKNEKIKIEELIKSAVEPFYIQAELKNVKITIQGDKDVSIKGDIQWLTEAISNIVKNCMEHTEHGAVEITYGCNNFYTGIAIKDTGKGIEKEDLPFIFQRFYKGKNSSADSVGIGLALAKQIICMQKGMIEVTSEVGKGTKFLIKFYM